LIGLICLLVDPVDKPEEGGDAKAQQTSKSGKPLETVKTQYFVGTEDGEVVSFDFKLEKDAESGKNISISRVFFWY